MSIETLPCIDLLLTTLHPPQRMLHTNLRLTDLQWHSELLSGLCSTHCSSCVAMLQLLMSQIFMWGQLSAV
jgi:hypothetical protein